MHAGGLEAVIACGGEQPAARPVAHTHCLRRGAAAAALLSELANLVCPSNRMPPL